MGAGTFRAVFEPAGGKLQHARYRLRWDWHLRNFLTALIPPAVLLIVLRLAERKFQQLGVDRFDMSIFDETGTKEEEDEAEGLGRVFGVVRRVERRLEALEGELERLRDREESERRGALVESARDVARGIVRKN